MPKDKLGVEIEVGDLVVSAASKAYGNFKIGRVEKVFPSGRVTMKYANKVNVYAYEEGAPDIPTKGTRAKRDENGRVVTADDSRGIKDYRGKPWRVAVREEYEYLQKDYTVVGHKWQWIREQAAENHILVLRKVGPEEGLNELHKRLNLDYDKEIPEWDGSSSD